MKILVVLLAFIASSLAFATNPMEDRINLVHPNTAVDFSEVSYNGLNFLACAPSELIGRGCPVVDRANQICRFMGFRGALQYNLSELWGSRCLPRNILRVSGEMLVTDTIALCDGYLKYFTALRCAH